MSSEKQTNILKHLGWDAGFELDFQSVPFPGSVPGRVVSENRHLYQVFTERDVLKTQISGRLRRQAEESGQYPVVGDWVTLTVSPGEEEGVIHAILPRRSQISRQASGSPPREQVVSANVDTVFIVGALDEGRSINGRRFERYLTLVRSSGAVGAIVLNKADLCPDIDGFIRKVQPSVAGVPVHPVSALQGTGLDALKSYITPGKTVAFLGPSGVGKSALINALLGEQRQKTGEIRERDHTGKHTTTTRELILVPGGGVVIDNPGMRQIATWAEEDDLLEGFEDVETLGRRCRFNDCKHNNEPGCAVRAAVENGDLDPGRLASFEKLRKEVRHHEARQSGNERRLERERWKKISQGQKARWNSE